MSERLFLALWPDSRVRAALDGVSRALATKGGRIIPAHNLHLTLAFLGNIGAARRACIEQAVASVRARPFAFALTAVEWRRKTGIVWATAAEAPAPLLDLVASLQAALAACQHSPESRPYRLHVTLARDVRLGPRRHAIVPIAWSAAEIGLVSSRLTPGGSDYTVEQRWSLY